MTWNRHLNRCLNNMHSLPKILECWFWVFLLYDLLVRMKNMSWTFCYLQQNVFQHYRVQGEVGLGASSFSSLCPSTVWSVCSSRELWWLASGSLWSWDRWVRCSHSNERCPCRGKEDSFPSPTALQFSVQLLWATLKFISCFISWCDDFFNLSFTKSCVTLCVKKKGIC